MAMRLSNGSGLFAKRYQRSAVATKPTASSAFMPTFLAIGRDLRNGRVICSFPRFLSRSDQGAEIIALRERDDEQREHEAKEKDVG